MYSKYLSVYLFIKIKERKIVKIVIETNVYEVSVSTEVSNV